MTINRPKFSGLAGIVSLLVIGFLAAATAQAADVTVRLEDNDGNAVSGFRWVMQEDATFAVDPNNPATAADDLLSLNFHASYHPIAQNDGAGLTGNTDVSFDTITVPGGTAADPARYYVSILPYSGYSISGTPVSLDNDGTDNSVTVIVQEHPIPTATISVFFFHDNFPINGAPDLPEESSPSYLPDGTLVDWTEFSVILEEPGGRYGAAGGQVIADAFGNPIGTDYDAGVPRTGTTPGGVPCFLNQSNVCADGTLHPDADGFLTIRNLAPGKYGIIPVPATGSNWQQSSTIEGTKVIDAWVKANEPSFFVEFGPPGPHVFLGFVKSTENGGFPAISQPPGTITTANLTGTITDMHLSRAPATAMFSGRPFPGCWVGLNESVGGLAGKGIYAAPCDADSNFNIPNVPPADYQLKVFDANLDVVIATQGVTVNADGSCVGAETGCNFGEVPVFNWFARLNTGIFNDTNQNGFWDTGETGIGPESQDVSIRWRDGTLYQNFPTDGEGLAPFDEVFPFFHWLVAEVSFANKKATGATFVVDDGGEIDTSTDTFPGYGELNPQQQADGQLFRTETGPVLTTGFQGFLGQTSVMHFGKTDYVNFDFSSFPATYVGENGGISGIIFYATTRAENEPQFAAAEEWEPGVPRVQVALYADGDIDSFPLGDFPGMGDVDWNGNLDASGNPIRDLDDDVIDDINGDGVVTLADVDNYPLGWGDPDCENDPNVPGNECLRGVGDVDRDDPLQDLVTDAVAEFNLGDAVQVTWTDSWDDSLPTECQGANNVAGSEVVPAITDDRCFDGLRNFNQIRPGVFDGGYAFVDYDMAHLGVANSNAAAAIQGFYDAITDPITGVPNADKLQLGLIPGDYIVESATPPGYEHIKEEDRNVDFGDEYIPSSQALAVTCVGADHLVPALLSMTTKDGSGDLDMIIPGIDPVDAAATFAGDTRPMCDRKKVGLSAGQNAAAEFFLMTDVPVVANISGITLNDLANEFNPASPSFSEKYAPPLLPIAFYDWQGKLVNRIYGDAYGRYNAVVPSTFTANLPQPSGMSPNMLLSCMNDAGPILNPNPDNDPDAPVLVIDPFYDSQYSQFCYTFQYMPGTITYLDTPVVSVSAFATSGPNPVDCERPTDTPMIASVKRRNRSGGGGPFVVAGQEIRINSMGRMDVPNPDWDGVNLADKNIRRDYRFAGGNQTQAYVEDASGVRTLLPRNGGSNRARIFAGVPTTIDPGDYQVIVVSRGVESPIGATLTVGVADANCPVGVGGPAGECGVRPNSNGPDPDTGNYDAAELYAVHAVAGPAPYPATPIQTAIDAAAPGDLIMVPPGSYDEMLAMWKPVKLQGWGAGAVFLNARQVPTEKIVTWRDKLAGLVTDGDTDQLPGQVLGQPGFPALAEGVFPTEEGAAIFVTGKRNGSNRFGHPANRGARIDGFSILGASTGGGIIANGFNQFLQISNNRLTGNAGAFGGGIRIGHPQLSHEVLDATDPAYDPDANGGTGNVGAILYDDAVNDRIRIHHNHIAKNGGFGGAGGGISLHTGADNYEVQENLVCGNFTQGGGAGIAHLGLSRNGLIEDNEIIFNESFSQANPQAGGGVLVSGQPALQGEQLTAGSGDVTIDANIIRGNLAGAGDGGGIRIQAINGQDIQADLDNGGAFRDGQWFRVNVYNNMITNNVAGLAGGGISVADALRVFIRNNTVANNDSTATTAEAFAPGIINATVPQPAGIVGRQHSTALQILADAVNVLDPTVIPTDRLTFSDPVIRDSIVHGNRSFYWVNDNPDVPCPVSGPAYCLIEDSAASDLGVLSALQPSALLNPRFSLLTDATGYATNNTSGDPMFINGYLNGPRDNLNIPEFTTLPQTAGAFDEGGNFIQITFAPLSVFDSVTGTLFDYHLMTGSPAIDAHSANLGGRLAVDIDNQNRPLGAGIDLGADEVQ